jgi:hypothetical protein
LRNKSIINGRNDVHITSLIKTLLDVKNIVIKEVKIERDVRRKLQRNLEEAERLR